MIARYEEIPEDLRGYMSIGDYYYIEGTKSYNGVWKFNGTHIKKSYMLTALWRLKKLFSHIAKTLRRVFTCNVLICLTIFFVASEDTLLIPIDFGPTTKNKQLRYQQWKKLKGRLYNPILIPIVDKNKDGIVNFIDLSWFAAYWLQPMKPEDWLIKK